MGWFDRSAARQQRIADAQNKAYLENPDGDDDAGPAWAYGIGGIPIVHWIGDLALLVRAVRRRRERKRRRHT